MGDTGRFQWTCRVPGKCSFSICLGGVLSRGRRLDGKVRQNEPRLKASVGYRGSHTLIGGNLDPDPDKGPFQRHQRPYAGSRA